MREKIILFILLFYMGSGLACHAGTEFPAGPGTHVVENQAAIQGYLDRDSYFPGETLALHVHTLSPRYGFSLVRLGIHELPLDQVHGLPGHAQNYRTDAFVQGAQWPVSHRYALPEPLTSGLYALKFVTEGGGAQAKASYLPFVVKGRKGPGMPSIVVMANTFTWQAYNFWGGGSFYKGNPRYPEDSPETMVNFDRPNDATCHDSPIGHTGCAEKHTAVFLHNNGYDSHEITNMDLHRDPDLLTGYKVLVINTHSEYWTREMFDHLEAFLKAGGSVLNISGNVLWWKVTVQGNRMECQKLGGTHVQTGEPGGKWKDLGRPSDPLLGVRSSPKGIHTFAPFQVLDAGHWLLDGTGLRDGDRIGAKGLNDGGASGWETDKLGPLAPPGTALLARGLNPGEGGADIVYFRTPAGGGVLSAGSISFAGSLTEDAGLTILVRNFLDAYR